MKNPNRELTQTGKRKLRNLIENLCANYDTDYGCLPLECDCYMLGVCHTHSPLCKYFRDAVLPAAPKLESSFCSSG